MKTIGLIGGMSWESTITYYEILNKEIAKALGGFHSATSRKSKKKSASRFCILPMRPPTASNATTSRKLPSSAPNSR